MTVWEFVVDRLHSAGVCDFFGLPGDYILNFYDKIENSNKIRMITCTTENNACHAADAYARVNGLGVVVATYCVGGFSLVNALACAYAEESPVIFISGSPGVKERKQDLYLHHMVRTFECQSEIFEKITCASTVLDNISMAAYEIDRVIDTVQSYKQPGYIELPRDMVDKVVSYDSWLVGTPPESLVSDSFNLEEALKEAVEWINNSERPVILAGVEIARYGFGKQLIKFAQAKNIPVATTFLGKSVINEKNPLSLGVYCGGLSNGITEETVNNSDCIIGLGVLMTDLHFGFCPKKVWKRNMILSTCQEMQIKSHFYKDVTFRDFFKKLIKADIKERQSCQIAKKSMEFSFNVEKGKKLTTSRLFDKLKNIITPNMAIVSDVGESMFGAVDIDTNCNHFLCPAFYTTMGMSIPAALGVQIADKNARPLVILGDGAFQMNASELSTIGKLGLNPIVVIVNNKGFLTERFFKDGPYNNIVDWNYHKYPEMIGLGKGYKVTTEEEFDKALDDALESKSFVLINAVVEKDDHTPAAKRMMGNFAKTVSLK